MAINYQSYNNYLSPSGGSDWSSLLNETQSLMNFGDPFGQSAQQTYNPSSQNFSYNVPGASASSPLGLGSGLQPQGISTPQTTVPTLGNSASTPATSPTAQAATLPTPPASSSSAALPSALASTNSGQSPTGAGGGGNRLLSYPVKFAADANAPITNKWVNMDANPNPNEMSSWTSAGQVWGDLIPKNNTLTGAYPSQAAYEQHMKDAWEAKNPGGDLAVINDYLGSYDKQTQNLNADLKDWNQQPDGNWKNAKTGAFSVTKPETGLADPNSFTIQNAPAFILNALSSLPADQVPESFKSLYQQIPSGTQYF